jgi:hypothetical protein
MVSNNGWSEQGSENPMVNRPACLIVEGAEKSIMYGVSDLYDRATDEFAEPLFVADFFTERSIPHEDNLLAQDSYLEDLAWSSDVSR